MKANVDRELALQVEGDDEEGNPLDRTVTAKRERAIELAEELLECVGGVDVSVTRRALQRIINLLGGEVEEG